MGISQKKKAISERNLYIRDVFRKLLEVRDLRPDEKGKSLDYWEGHTTAIVKVIKAFNLTKL